jgi:hypothetical protein
MPSKTFDYERDVPKGRLTRGQAIRWFCVCCVCGEVHAIKNCPDTICPLYRYRLGTEKA